MLESSTRSLDRLGAISGAVAITLLFILLMAFPAPPAADESIATIAQAVADDERMLLFGGYVGVVMGGAWLLFGIAVAARLRRAEPAGGAWWMVALAGITASTAVGLIGNVVGIMFVRAVGHGLSGPELWTIYSGDLMGFVQGIPLAVFMLGAGMATWSTRVFPSWTGVAALTAVPLLVVGVASVAGREVDGGVFVFPLMLAYLCMIVWTLAVCVSLWRPSVPRPKPAPTAA